MGHAHQQWLNVQGRGATMPSALDELLPKLSKAVMFACEQ